MQQKLYDLLLTSTGAIFTTAATTELIKIIIGAALPLVIKEVYLWIKKKKDAKNNANKKESND